MTDRPIKNIIAYGLPNSTPPPSHDLVSSQMTPMRPSTRSSSPICHGQPKEGAHCSTKQWCPNSLSDNFFHVILQFKIKIKMQITKFVYVRVTLNPVRTARAAPTWIFMPVEKARCDWLTSWNSWIKSNMLDPSWNNFSLWNYFISVLFYM